MSRGEIHLQAGTLAVLLGLCGFGLMHWYAVLLGWGIATLVFGVIETRGGEA